MTTDTMITEVVLPGVVEPDGLRLHRRAMPVPNRGQALVEVEATGISYAEQSMRRNLYPGQPKFPFVPGYDLVGTVRSVGPDGDDSLIGTRVAAVTKTGAWASHLVVDVDDLPPVPADLDPAEAETVVVNGVTAWQLLRGAELRAGQTILVHGANGGVGTVLVQLGRHLGLRVIGTAAAKHHDALRALGVEPLDYRDPDLAARVRELSPGGVDAVFDPVAGPGVRTSYDLLAPGGKLVVYGNASALGSATSIVWVFVKLLARLYTWNALPNGHRAGFYNFWAGRLTRPTAFRRRLRTDLGTVLDLLRQGVIVPQIAARYPLTEVSAAMVFAETRSRAGKVVLEP
ncbi:medium chain dehydrogenase/reductase family protein [Micromonospora sp. WMMD710]|uniref:medium chain dehydrogenase/reductase family protein n=1 Tax=Micromonospora sp. WMMD710 TaxID=3016085 RepID=UPI0024176755|nr:medium chain dehydrogenase/reductase family protein [Micromonospora sp. WMMD710]MDG4760567.1 medium chain dehydrogenase/reductase family protein [Micromonospora sp. WMMD710]